MGLIPAEVTFGSNKGFKAVQWFAADQDQPLTRIGTGQEVERISRQNVTPAMIADASGGLLVGSQTFNWQQTYNRIWKNPHGVQCRVPGLADLPFIVKNQSSITSEADISGYRAAHKRTGSIMSAIGSSTGEIYYQWAGTKLYKANTSTGALELADSFTNNIVVIAELNVNGTMVFAVATDGTTDDIKYTTDPTAGSISWTNLVAFSSGDRVDLMGYFPTVGKGINILAGKVGGVNGWWWQPNDTAAAWSLRPLVTAATKDQPNPNASIVTLTKTPASGDQFNNSSPGAAEPWTSQGNIFSSNDSRASNSFTAGNETDFICITNLGWEGKIPSGSLIADLTVTAEASEQDGADNVYWSRIAAWSAPSETGAPDVATINPDPANVSAYTTSPGELTTADRTDTVSIGSIAASNLTAEVLGAHGASVGISFTDSSGTSPIVQIDYWSAITLTFRPPGSTVPLPLGSVQANRNPSFPNRISFHSPVSDETTTAHKPRELWHADITYDATNNRPLLTLSQANEGMRYVSDVCSHQGGWVLVGSDSEGLGVLVKFLDPSGNLLTFGFPGHNNINICKVNACFPRGNALILEVVSYDNSGTVVDAQWWIKDADNAWHLDTQSQSVTGADGTLVDIAVEPLAWGLRTLNTRDNLIYRMFPNSTHTAVARQFMPVDLSQNTRLVYPNEKRALPTTSTSEDTRARLQFPQWAIGPQEANLSLLTVQYSDRLVSANSGSYGTVHFLVSTDAGANFTDLNTFDSAFEKYNIAGGKTYRTLIIALELDHTADTAKSANALGWILEIKQAWPKLLKIVVYADPDTMLPNPLEWEKTAADSENSTSVVGRLILGNLRDSAGNLGILCEWSDAQWSAPLGLPPRGQTQASSQYVDARGNKVYRILTFDQVPGVVA